MLSKTTVSEEKQHTIHMNDEKGYELLFKEGIYIQDIFIVLT